MCRSHTRIHKQNRNIPANWPDLLRAAASYHNLLTPISSRPWNGIIEAYHRDFPELFATRCLPCFPFFKVWTKPKQGLRGMTPSTKWTYHIVFHLHGLDSHSYRHLVTPFSFSTHGPDHFFWQFVSIHSLYRQNFGHRRERMQTSHTSQPAQPNSAAQTSAKGH